MSLSVTVGFDARPLAPPGLCLGALPNADVATSPDPTLALRLCAATTAVLAGAVTAGMMVLWRAHTEAPLAFLGPFLCVVLGVGCACAMTHTSLIFDHAERCLCVDVRHCLALVCRRRAVIPFAALGDVEVTPSCLCLDRQPLLRVVLRCPGGDVPLALAPDEEAVDAAKQWTAYIMALAVT